MFGIGPTELFIIILICLPFYLIPSIVAKKRNHKNTSAIIAMNILLGWTFLFWAGALIWALTANVQNAGGTEQTKYKICPSCQAKNRKADYACISCGKPI